MHPLRLRTVPPVVYQAGRGAPQTLSQDAFVASADPNHVRSIDFIEVSKEADSGINQALTIPVRPVAPLG